MIRKAGGAPGRGRVADSNGPELQGTENRTLRLSVSERRTNKKFSK